jgi:hypothetical protein
VTYDDERSHRQQVDFRPEQTVYTVVFQQDFSGVTIWRKEPEKASVLVGLHEVLGEEQINRWKLAVAARSPDPSMARQMMEHPKWVNIIWLTGNFSAEVLKPEDGREYLRHMGYWALVDSYEGIGSAT